MSQAISLLTLTIQAAGAVTESRFVGFDGAQISAEGARAMGVSLYGVEDGKDLPVDVIGTTVVETGGAVAIDDELVADTDGRAIVNPAVGGEIIMADPLETANGAGELIEVLLRR